MSRPELTLYLIRHGKSNASIQNPPVRQGPQHPLSPTGISQAKMRGEELSKLHIDVLLTSPLVRAKQTADIISSFPKVPFPQEIPELQEIIRPDVIYGVPLDSFANGLYKAAMRDSINRHDLHWRLEDQPEVWHLLLSSLREAGLNHEPLNRSESWAELFDRASAVGDWLVEEFLGQTVAMVSHSNLGAFLLTSRLLQKPDAAAIFTKSWHLFLKHGGMATIEYRHGQWTLTRFDHNKRSP